MNRIVVIGRATVDVLAQSSNQIIARDSNPGKVKLSYGGVGHNIASNLGILGLPVSFITTFSQDSFARGLIEECISNHLDISNAQHLSGYSSALYIAVVQSDGDMNVAIADMEILSHLDVDKVIPVIRSLDEDDILVIDTNLTEGQIAQFVDNAKCRVFADPISVSKSAKIASCYSSLYFFKPNQLEAEYLTGLSSDDEKGMLQFFLDKGVRNIAISLGKRGVIASDGKQFVHLSSAEIEAVSTTGAGDSFMAGYVYGLSKGCGFADCLRYATAASWITLESMDTVSDKMSRSLLEEYYQKVLESTSINNLD